MTTVLLVRHGRTTANSDGTLAGWSPGVLLDEHGEAQTKALAERGVKFQGAPHLIHRHADGTEEWMAFFEDPDGNYLALMEQVKPVA